jgi:hypothetical protein
LQSFSPVPYAFAGSPGGISPARRDGGTAGLEGCAKALPDGYTIVVMVPASPRYGKLIRAAGIQANQ